MALAGALAEVRGLVCRHASAQAADPVLALALGRVHRFVDRVHQVVAGDPVVGKGHEADGDADADPRVPCRRFDRPDAQSNLLRDHRRAARFGLGEQHDELVAAEPGRDVDPANAVADHAGDRDQHAIAQSVAVGVVDELEVVQVRHQEAEPAPEARRALDLAVHRRQHERPVGKPGQGIGRRQPDRRIARPPLLAPNDHRDVGEQHEGGQVDPDQGQAGRVEALVEGRRRGDRHVARGRGSGDGDRRAGRDDEGRAGHHQRIGEEERAAGAAGEDHDQGDDHDCDDALGQVLAAAQGAGRQDVVSDHEEEAGDDEDGQEGRLARRPQAGGGDEHGGGEQE